VGGAFEKRREIGSERRHGELVARTSAHQVTCG
jgi:hypothetical protein